ncbi:hypothetical protein ACTMU2_35765 (plasmid) [Cupriavidus basilensis]
MPDRITSQHFTGQSAVTLEPGAENLPVPIADVPKLIGAIDGSEISVSFDDETYVFEIRHPWLEDPMIRVLSWDADEGARRLIINQNFKILGPHRRKGLGVRSIATEMRMALHLGIPAVSCIAAGAPGDTLNGYYTWPVLGFNADLTPHDIQALPPDFVGCRSLNDLMQRREALHIGARRDMAASSHSTPRPEVAAGLYLASI